MYCAEIAESDQSQVILQLWAEISVYQDLKMWRNEDKKYVQSKERTENELARN